MKKIIILFNLILACVFAGCDKSNVTDENVQDGDCLVTINPVGEINTAESPMTKASSSTNDIYLVQVYNDSECYAWGYFDNTANMTLYLKNGASYKISVAVIMDAKTLLGERYDSAKNCIWNNHSYADVFDFKFVPQDYDAKLAKEFPYILSTDGQYFISTLKQEKQFFSSWRYPINRYQYSKDQQLTYYQSNGLLCSLPLRNTLKYFAIANIGEGRLNNVKYPVCTDWFYGEVDSFTPSGRYETLNMDFRRTGFKLKYELSGVTDGEVTVKIYNKRSDYDTSTFFENTSNTSTYTSETKFFAFYDTKSAWQYAENYSEKVLVNVVWKRGTGVTQDLGEKSVTIKRNCLNNIKIALGSDDKGAGINMSTEAEDWSERNSTDITVQ